MESCKGGLFYVEEVERVEEVEGLWSCGVEGLWGCGVDLVLPVYAHH